MDYAAQIAYLLVFGIGFGLAATVPPGPINTQIARRTLKFGFLPGLAFGGGSLFIENALAVAAAMGYGADLGSHPRVLKLTLFVGFIVLSVVGTFAVWSGYRAWQNPAESRHSIDTAGEDLALIRASPGLTKTQIVSMPKSFFAGMGMAIVSPFTIIFWIVGLPSAAYAHLASAKTATPLLLGILLGSSAWIFGYTSMIAYLKRYRSTGMWADLVGGIMLLIFAGLALVELARLVLRPGSSTAIINGGHFP